LPAKRAFWSTLVSAPRDARRLALVGEDLQKLDAVLVTHEHGDHAGGLRVLLRTVDCPVYISARTSDGYISERTTSTTEEARKRAKALKNRVEQIESSQISHRRDRLPSVHHSARRGRQFWLHGDAPGRKDCDVMDFGQITTLVSERLRGCAAVVIESNHSRDMLKACDAYPGN